VSVKVCISYTEENECAGIVSRLFSPGIKISKPYSNGKYIRRYITWPNKKVDKAEHFRYNESEQMFEVDDVEKQYPID